jgi:AcrR family transcriptional regulator
MPRGPSSRHPRRRIARQARARATVEHILEATARVLVSRGYAAATTNHIAARAGVSIGTLYEYFSSKQALVAALVGRHLDEAEQRLAELADRVALGTPSLDDAVRAIVSAMLDLHATRPRLHRVLFEEVPHSKAVCARIAAIEDAQSEALSALLPLLAPVREPRVTARVIVELLEALTHRWLVTKAAEPLPRERMQLELETLVLAYVRAASTASGQPTTMVSRGGS